MTETAPMVFSMMLEAYCREQHRYGKTGNSLVVSLFEGIVIIEQEIVVGSER